MGSWRTVGFVVTAVVVALALLLPSGGAEAPAVPPRPASTAPPGAPPGAPPVDPPDTTLSRASEVRAAWDARRSRAWAADDPAAVRDLYAAGSRAAAADLRLLRRWQQSGRRVEAIRTQVLGLAVVRSGPDRLLLRVVDRVAGGRTVSREGTEGAGDTGRPLDTTSATARLVELRRTDGTWRVSLSRRAD